MLKQEMVYHRYVVSNSNALPSFYIKQNLIESEEENIGLGLSDPVTKTYYVLEDKPYAMRPRANRNKQTLFALDFVLSKDQTFHKRSIYTILDILGDVGGLLDGLRILGGVVMSIYTFAVRNPLNTFLVKSLFKTDQV